jgi:flavodoxin
MPQIVFATTSHASQQAQNGVLIVYLSRTQNTKVLAQIIQQQVGGELIALELETPYPKDYQQTVKQVQQENESGYLPALATQIDNLQQYHTVFIGFPTWGMRLPPPIKTFLSQTDLAGKVVYPFNTHAGYGAGNSFDTLATMCSGCKIKPGLSIKGGIERDGILLAIKGQRVQRAEQQVAHWLADNGY